MLRPRASAHPALVLLVTGCVTLCACERRDAPRATAGDWCTDPDVPRLPVIEALPFDFAQTRGLSRFRSCSGHSYHDRFEREPLSSQKHYVLGPPGQGDACADAIAVLAPFDGTVALVERDPRARDCAAGARVRGFVRLVSDTEPPFLMELEHVNPAPGVAAGARVRAGQRVGATVLPEGGNTWDLHFRTHPGPRLEGSHCGIGAFLAPRAAAALVAHGVEPEQLLVSRSERRQQPCIPGDPIPGTRDRELRSPAPGRDLVLFR